jgi:CHAD domain-containing protein
MLGVVAIPVVEANLLRSRLRHLLSLREEFLINPQHETIHDLRVASRRIREVLDYLEPSLPPKVQTRLMNLSRRITKTLGTAREAEVNLAIVTELSDHRKIDPVAAELLLHNQRLRFEKGHQKARKRISNQRYRYFDKFLMSLKGTHAIPITESGVLHKRHLDFVSFPWDTVPDDERLHDLRIRTKKFRYAVEINNRIHKRRLGHFIRKIRNLQEVLGRIHDLYVLELATTKLIEEWDDSSLKIVPATLRFNHDIILTEKQSLYQLVYPRYSKILESSQSLFLQHSHAAAV